MKRNLLKVLMVLALGATICLPGMASAGMMYTTEASFTPNIQSGYYLEDFGDYSYGSFIGPSLILASGSFGYTMSAPNDLWSGDSSMSTNFFTDAITITFTGSPTPVTAVGGQFFPIDLPGTDMSGQITVTFADGSTASPIMTYPTRPFIGYTSNLPIASMTIQVTDPTYTDPDTGSLQWPTVDHLYVGSAVPLPPTVLLMGSGLIGLGLLRFRRKNRA